MSLKLQIYLARFVIQELMLISVMCSKILLMVGRYDEIPFKPNLDRLGDQAGALLEQLQEMDNAN